MEAENSVEFLFGHSAARKILLYLFEHGECYPMEMWRNIDISVTSTLYKIYPALERMGLLRRKAEGRVVKLVLTEKGKEVASRLREIAELLGVGNEGRGKG